MAGKTSKVKPGVRRAPRKEPPIMEREMLFASMVMKGSKNPNATQLERIEEAGKTLGIKASDATRMFHRKPVQAWMDKYRANLMTEMVRTEVRELRRKGYTREDVLTRLFELASLEPERTKNTITGQVEALKEMGVVMGIAVAPRDPDSFFKGRTDEEIAHYAEYGCFAPSVVN